MTLTLLALSFAATPASGQWQVTTLGDGGELYELRIDSFGQLFPESALGVDSEHRVMALDTTRVDGETERLLVPSTEGSERESRPALVYDAGQLFILWVSSTGGGAPALRLVGYDGEEFGETIEVSGDAQGLMGPPRLALTRDDYGPDSSSLSRTTIHLLWWQGPRQVPDVFYTPIVLVEGQYLGWNPIFDLGSFDRHSDLDAPADALELFRTVTIEPGTDDGSVVVALPRPATGRLLTLGIQLLPAALQNLAGEIRAHIIGVGRNDVGPRRAATLAGDVRDLIEDSNVRLHAGVLGFIADHAVAAVLENGELDVEELAEVAARAALDAGASILGNAERSVDRSCERMELGPQAGVASPALHEIEICLASDRSLPETEPLAPHFLFLSEEGADVLIAWLDPEAQLLYRSSVGDDWSEPVAVATGEGLAVEQALRLLEKQVRLD